MNPKDIPISSEVKRYQDTKDRGSIHSRAFNIFENHEEENRDPRDLTSFNSQNQDSTETTPEDVEDTIP